MGSVVQLPAQASIPPSQHPSQSPGFCARWLTPVKLSWEVSKGRSPWKEMQVTEMPVPQAASVPGLKLPALGLQLPAQATTPNLQPSASSPSLGLRCPASSPSLGLRCPASSPSLGLRCPSSSPSLSLRPPVQSLAAESYVVSSNGQSKRTPQHGEDSKD